MARKLAHDLVADERLVSLADMSNALNKQSTHLSKLDRHFKMELTWIEKSGEALTQIVKKAIMLRLPTHSRRASIETAYTELLALRQEKFVTSAAPTIVGTFDAILITIGNMKIDISPSIDDSSSPFYAQVVNALGHFLVVLPQSDTPGKALTSSEALSRKLGDYEKGVAAGVKVSVVSLENLRRFKWLFKLAELDRLIEGC